MSAQSVLPRLMFFSLFLFKRQPLRFCVCANTKNCQRDNKLSEKIDNNNDKYIIEKKMIDYCGNSFSVWVLWKALLIMKLWTDSRHFTGQH